MSQDNLIGRRTMAVDGSGKTRIPAKWQRLLGDGEVPEQLSMTLRETEDGSLEVVVHARN